MSESFLPLVCFFPVSTPSVFCPVLLSNTGREGIERGHEYFGIRLQSVCARVTQMLSVLPLGEMGQL